MVTFASTSCHKKVKFGKGTVIKGLYVDDAILALNCAIVLKSSEAKRREYMTLIWINLTIREL